MPFATRISALHISDVAAHIVGSLVESYRTIVHIPPHINRNFPGFATSLGRAVNAEAEVDQKTRLSSAEVRIHRFLHPP
jgi:hypothetical protein